MRSDQSVHGLSSFDAIQSPAQGRSDASARQQSVTAARTRTRCLTNRAVLRITSAALIASAAWSCQPTGRAPSVTLAWSWHAALEQPSKRNRSARPIRLTSYRPGRRLVCLCLFHFWHFWPGTAWPKCQWRELCERTTSDPPSPLCLAGTMDKTVRNWHE